MNAPMVLALALFLVGAFVTKQDILLQGSIALTYAIAATGLGMALGLAGEFLLGQLALFAVSAYVTAVLVSVNHGWNYWPAAIVGCVAAMLAGLVLSVIGLRISRFYFALIGFFVVSLLPNIVQIFSSQTGGSVGLPVSTVPSLLGTSMGTRGLFWLAGVFLVVSLLLVRNVRSSPLGVQMRRMRENPAVLSSSGIPVWRVRLSTYLLCSLLAGVGGAIYAELYAYLLPDFFDLTTTILLFAAVLVGGQTTLLGPSLGVILLYVFPNVVIDVPSDSDLIYGTIVLISVILFRGGIEGSIRDLTRKLVKALRRKRLLADDASTSNMTSHEMAGVSSSELVDLLWGLREGVSEADRLVVRGAQKHYGGVTALSLDDEDTVTVVPGKVHLLLGPNGSGKTTLLNITSGLSHVDAGTVTLGSREVAQAAPSQIARLGVGRSFQSPSLPPEVTPREILSAALAQLRHVSYVHWLTSDPIAWRARRETSELAGRMLTAAGLGSCLDQPCTGLTSGQTRILDVLLALASRSMLVMLDEPAAGLSEFERGQLSATIRGLADRGVGFLVVEHDLDLALNLADHVTVLGQGRLLASGDPDHIKTHPEVREVLIGATQ
ncbi:MAG TPA: ATP-binding cassette domain-containing protein [Solirubrobacteraceae bacterium]|nr:ATP-binding cassette domain-containing protein [Solirubrobacteraceae bacterium]